MPVVATRGSCGQHAFQFAQLAGRAAALELAVHLGGDAGES
jgi:hypothetical protein